MAIRKTLAATAAAAAAADADSPASQSHLSRYSVKPESVPHTASFMKKTALTVLLRRPGSRYAELQHNCLQVSD